MIIGLRQLYEIPGEKTEVDTVISEERLQEINSYSFIGPVTLKGMIRNRAGVVILNYTAEAEINAGCDRCLCDVCRKYSFDFEHVLVKSLSNEDTDEYVVTEGNDLDMDEVAIDDVLLEMPTKLLCRDDCKGLCSVCGVDLNYSECDCNRS